MIVAAVTVALAIFGAGVIGYWLIGRVLAWIGVGE